jgi:hypothetical protein
MFALKPLFVASVRTETVVCCFKAMAKRDGGEKSSFVSDIRSASKDRPIELPQSVAYRQIECMQILVRAASG